MNVQVFSGEAQTISGETRNYPNVRGTCDGDIKVYSDLKPDFDRICWRIDDCLVYFYTDEVGDVHKYDLKKLKERCKDIQVSEIVGYQKNEDRTEDRERPIYKRKPFLDIWEIDPEKKKYRTMDIRPKNCPDDIYNLWKGYDIENKGKDCTEGGDIEPFRQLLLDLVGGKVEHRDYVECYLAHIFQYPELQTPIALVFQGDGGEGKSKFWKFIGKLMGENTFFSTAEPEKSVFEKHATQIEGKKLVVFEEMEQATHKKHMSKIRNMIDGDGKISFRPLNCTAYAMENLISFVFCSNDKVPIIMYGRNNTRRFILFQASGMYVEGKISFTDPRGDVPKQFWETWLEWENKIENQKAVYDYLMNLKPSMKWLYDSANFPRTAYQKEVEQKCLPLDIKWIDGLITKEFPLMYYAQNSAVDTREVVVSTEQLSKNFATTFSLPKEVSVGSFGMKLTELVKKKELPFYNRDVHNKPVRSDDNQAAWRFTRKDVYDWLVKNDYTDYKMEGDELPSPVGKSYY